MKLGSRESGVEGQTARWDQTGAEVKVSAFIPWVVEDQDFFFFNFLLRKMLNMHKYKKSSMMNLYVAFTKLQKLPANGQYPKPSKTRGHLGGSAG